MIKKHVIFLLICLFSLVELFSLSHADIIYLEKETLIGWFSIIEDRDIVYLKDGGIIKGKLIERSPEQVKIKVISESTIETEKESVSRQKKVDSIIFVYGADEVEKVEVRLSEKKVNTASIGNGIGCGCIGLVLFFSFLGYLSGLSQ